MVSIFQVVHLILRDLKAEKQNIMKSIALEGC